MLFRSPVVASALATGVTILFSYVVNRTWIFETDRSHASAFRRFVAASGLSMALNTGLMHVTVGVIMLLAMVGIIQRGRVPGDKAEVVELIGLYWHFVDVVWVVIFTLVYLIPV